MRAPAVDGVTVRSGLQYAYLVVVLVVVSSGVSLLAKAEILIPAAAPFGLILIAALFWLAPRPQLVGWGLFTLWLSTTYLTLGGIEIAATLVVAGLAVLGVLRSSWFLVAAWVIHPVWDLVPRQLPDLLHDLPVACLIYDLLIAGYLAWRSRRGAFVGAVMGRRART